LLATIASVCFSRISCAGKFDFAGISNLKKGIFLPEAFVVAHTGDRAMLPKSFCFLLAGLLVVTPLWILMTYGITADGRPHKTLIGMGFCFAVGVFWLCEDLKNLLRTRSAPVDIKASDETPTAA
jgi:hypothetical protein